MVNLKEAAKHDKPVIVFAIGSLKGGGAERVVLNLINNWNNEQFMPVLLLAERKGSYLNSVSSEVKIISINVALKFINTPLFTLRLRKALKPLNLAGIISHTHNMSRMIMRAHQFKAFSCPILLVEHNNLGKKFLNYRSKLASNLVRREMSFLYKSANNIIGVSEGVAKSIKQELDLKKQSVHVIYNPIDFDQIRIKKDIAPGDNKEQYFMSLPRPVVIGVGRLTKQKGFEDLIKAFSGLAENQQGSLVILGEGELKKHLQKITKEVGIEQKTHFLGFVKNPWWYITHSDLFVMSSYWEGFPMVLLETMACETPIIATNCSFGPSEIIVDDQTGKLVRVGDIEQLTNTISATLKNQSLMKAWTDNASKEVIKFKPNLILDQYIQLALKS